MKKTQFQLNLLVVLTSWMFVFLGGIVQGQETSSEGEIEEVVITGSRIARPNLSQPTPVSTLSAEDILVSGSTDLGRQLAELPSLGSTRTLSGSSNSFGDLAGLNLADLRRLGTVRTLTLLDGKRHVGGSPGTTSVDLNSVPTALIERVEIITGGASAVYGSDAVSGVINIITRKDFEGFNFDVQGGQAAEGGYAQNYNVGFTYGTDLGNDKSNFTISYRNSHIDDVQANDLSFPDDYGTVVNPLDTGEDDGIPDRLLMRNVISELIDENGTLLLDAVVSPYSSDDAVVVFDDNGNPQPQVRRDLTNSGAFGTVVGGRCEFCFEIEDYVTVIPEVEQDIFNTTYNFEFSELATAYLEAKYVKSNVVENLQPSFNFGTMSINVDDNPFIDEGLRAALQGAGFTGADANVTMARFHNDNGGRINKIERTTVRIVGGVEGLFNTGVADFTYDFYYNHGTVENDVLGLNRRLPDNFQQAVDAISDPVTNQPRCRDTSPGVLGRTCIPFNPFGQQNTPEALAYSFTSTREKQKLRQSNAGFTFVSDSSNMFELPAGPVDFAGGIEWRKERSATEGDPVVIADLTESAAQPNEKGGFEVGEAFVEFSLPLVRNVFLVNDLTADVAYRAADYTHSGRANASKYALSWSIVPQFTLRGTAGKAVRAPAITEAFRPTTPGFSSVTDPCDTDNVNNDPDRAANCAALGLPGGFEAMDNVSVISESSGNPDLSPEESTSFTYGFIFQPDWFAPGLSLTADLYDIEIEDAITLVTAQNIVNNCVDATGGPDFSFCDQFTRDGSQNIDFVRSTFINASKFETEGIDMQVNYEKSLDEFGINWLEGVLNFSFTGNYLRELNVFEFQNRPDEIDIERGEIGDPIRAYRSSLSYQIADIALGWEVRYLGNQRRFNIGVDNSEDMSPSDTGTSTYHDVNFRWFLPTGNIRLELYGGINNATDEEPPIGIVGVEGNEAIYDAIGRFYFLGIRGNL